MSQSSRQALLTSEEENWDLIPITIAGSLEIGRTVEVTERSLEA